MDEIFKKHLKIYAIQKYGSLKKFAKKIDISASTLSQYLNLKTKPCYDFFKKLALDGCDMNWLFGTENKTEIKNIRNIVIDNTSEKLYKIIIEEKEKQIKLLTNMMEMQKNESTD